MRALYILRVFLVSLEAAVLMLALLIWTLLEAEAQVLANSISLDADLLKYVSVLPTGIAAWIVRETRALLQEDSHTAKVLTAWPDYWRLKTHVWVCLAYALLFAAMGLSPLVLKPSTAAGSGLLLLTSIAGQLVNAASLLAARIAVREQVVRLKEW